MTKTLTERIHADIEEAVENILLKYQDEMNIESGDIDPLDNKRLEETQDILTDFIRDILCRQPISRSKTTSQTVVLGIAEYIASGFDDVFSITTASQEEVSIDAIFADNDGHLMAIHAYYESEDTAEVFPIEDKTLDGIASVINSIIEG